MEKSDSDQDIADPLSDVTRVERRWLLIMNIVVATMAYGGVVPSEIDALGLRASQISERTIFTIAWLVAMYFHVAFLLYVAADFRAWKGRFSDVKAGFVENKINERDSIYPGFRDLVFSDTPPQHVTDRLKEFGDLAETRYRTYRLRAKFEMYFPLLVSFTNLPVALIYELAA